MAHSSTLSRGSRTAPANCDHRSVIWTEAKKDELVATTNDLKNGLVLKLDNQLWQVLEFQHVKPGKGRRSFAPSSRA